MGRLKIKAYGKYWTLTEVAQHCGVSIGMVHRRLNAGKRGSALFLSLRPRPRASTSIDLPWELDAAAQSFVDEHPDGGTLEEIAHLYDCSAELIRLIERRALRRMAAALGEDPLRVASARGYAGGDAP